MKQKVGSKLASAARTIDLPNEKSAATSGAAASKPGGRGSAAKGKTAQKSTLGEISTVAFGATLTNGNAKNGHSNGQGDHLNVSDARRLLTTLMSVRRGDFGVRMKVDEGVLSNPTDTLTYRIAQELNDIIEMNQSLVRELERTSTIVGKRAKFHSELRYRTPPALGQSLSKASILL